jgi:hypothetical protein
MLGEGYEAIFGEENTKGEEMDSAQRSFGG